jgi:hypothetical protein
MGFGFAGVVVVDRTVIVMMMMACRSQMLDLMGNIEHIYRGQPSRLHGKAVQGKKHQQESAKEATHGDQSEKPVSDYSSRLQAPAAPGEMGVLPIVRPLPALQ